MKEIFQILKLLSTRMWKQLLEVLMDTEFQGYIQELFLSGDFFVLAISLSTNMCNNADFPVLLSIEREEE